MLRKTLPIPKFAKLRSSQRRFSPRKHKPQPSENIQLNEKEIQGQSSRQGKGKGVMLQQPQNKKNKQQVQYCRPGSADIYKILRQREVDLERSRDNIDFGLDVDHDDQEGEDVTLESDFIDNEAESSSGGESPSEAEGTTMTNENEEEPAGNCQDPSPMAVENNEEELAGN